MKNKSILLVFLLLITYTVSFAQQPGDLDGDFDANGSVITGITDSYDAGNSVVVQPDGKIVVTGTSGGSPFFNNPTNFTTMRYETDGSLDISFGTNGIVTTDLGPQDQANGIALQPDGKIVVGGASNALTALDAFAIVRYNQDGTIDNTFSTVNQSGFFLGPIGICRAIAIQTDGKIVAAGTVDIASRNFILARYNIDGTIDSSFAVNGVVTTDFGGLDDNAYSVAIQADGKIVLAGNSDNGLDTDFAVARYNSDGSLDNTFSVNGMVTTDFIGNENSARSVLTQPDGKIVVAGTTINEFQTVNLVALTRYNSNGTLDNSFGESGKVITLTEGVGSSSILQPDGKIIVTARFAFFVLVRYLEDGTLDADFGVDGIASESIGIGGSSEINSCALQPDGKIVAVGSASIDPGNSDFDFAVARFITGLNLGVVSFSVQDNAMLIYPNPIQESVTLDYTLTSDETISIDLFDISGSIVQSFVRSEKRIKGIHKETLVLEATLPSGSYILTLNNGTGRSSIRVVK